MIGARIVPIGRENFFDSERVMKALSEGQRRKLSKFGAFVQRRAKTSIRPAAVENRTEIRKAKKRGQHVTIRYRPSRPGEPPRSRKGELKKLILFGYDPIQRDVLIGPTLVAGRASETPARMEFGGEFVHKKSRKVIKVEARPFMRPAMEAEKKARMPAMFRDSLVDPGS